MKTILTQDAKEAAKKSLKVIDSAAEMVVDFLDKSNNLANDDSLTDTIDVISVKLAPQQSIDILDKINGSWEITKDVMARNLIESKRRDLWTQLSNNYPQEFQKVDRYHYDESTRNLTEIYGPKSWTQFICFINEHLTAKEKEFADLLKGGECSEFSQLSSKIHEHQNMLTLAKIISELREHKIEYSKLFENVYNDTVENILSNK